MYDSYDEYFERHFDFFRDRADYEAYMKGEEGAEGSLPMDCGPSTEQTFLVTFEDDSNFGNEGVTDGFRD